MVLLLSGQVLFEFLDLGGQITFLLLKLVQVCIDQLKGVEILQLAFHFVLLIWNVLQSHHR